MNSEYVFAEDGQLGVLSIGALLEVEHDARAALERARVVAALADLVGRLIDLGLPGPRLVVKALFLVVQ